MRIEKVNDNQIRCTLTKEDLASRKLKISELSYGSDKAKSLFRDMMQQASFEFGFEAEDIPLMIEAIPISGDSIVLIITKVEDPEELDTRFANFAPSVHDTPSPGSIDELVQSLSSDAENVLDLFKKFKEAATDKKDPDKLTSMFDGMAFSFDSITRLASVCKSANSFFTGVSSVYKDSDDSYLLTVNRSRMDVTDFVKACNLTSEFGGPIKGAQLGEAFLEEHYESICPKDALSIVSFL